MTTTTEPTTADIVLMPEVRMPAEIAAQMRAIVPRLEEALATIAGLSPEMEEVGYWLNTGVLSTEGVYDKIHDTTPYGEVFALFQQIAAHADAARGVDPDRRVDWYDRLNDRLDHYRLEECDIPPKSRQMYEDRIRTRAMAAEVEG